MHAPEGPTTPRGEAPQHPKGGTQDPHAYRNPAGSTALGLERGRPRYWLWGARGCRGDARSDGAMLVSGRGPPKRGSMRKHNDAHNHTHLLPDPLPGGRNAALGKKHAYERVPARTCNSQVVCRASKSMDSPNRPPWLPQVMRPASLGPLRGAPSPLWRGCPWEARRRRCEGVRGRRRVRHDGQRGTKTTNDNRRVTTRCVENGIQRPREYLSDRDTRLHAAP